MTEQQKHENFQRLLDARTQKALNFIRLIGNLSNPVNYRSDPDEIAKALRLLRDEINVVQLQFSLVHNRRNGG